MGATVVVGVGEIDLGECGIGHVELDHTRANNEPEKEGHNEDEGY